MSVAVGLGLMQFPFDDAKGFWRWVDLAEASSIDSVWQTDRIISSDPQLECLSVMAALAGRTRRLKFGMNVVSLALRDPILVAKQCATIDVLSEGRLLPAFGIGSPQAPEWAALGLDERTRGARTDEALEIIHSLWRQESVDFTGRFWTLKGAVISPKPVQRELPMWIGGSSPAAIRRTARYGTGWQAGSETPAEIAPIITAIATAASEAGRPIDPDHYGAGFAFHFGLPDDPAIKQGLELFARRTKRDPLVHYAVGDAEIIIGRIADYAAAGVSKFILRPAASGDAIVLAQTERLIAEVLPEILRRWPKAKRPSTAEKRDHDPAAA